MEEIQLVDTTLRDGNQSLWGATGITTQTVLAVAPHLDRAGFAAIDFTTSTHMAVSVRYHRENPWERIRAARRLMPHTPLGFLTTGLRFISWDRTPDAVMQLAMDLLVRAGLQRFCVAEPMNDMAGARRVAEMCKVAGAKQVVVALVFSLSPVHTDAYYAEKVAEIRAADAAVDAIYIKDPGGLLTPDRVRTLVPTVLAAAGGLPVELHSHCTTGLAPLCYLEAVQLGIRTLHTAVPPLANGTSQPSALNVCANLSQLGYAHRLDESALQGISALLLTLAKRKGLPQGTPPEYDVAYYRHQVPGGMISTLRRQLTEMGMADKLPSVLNEVQRVRQELGYPIMVTPFSQFVGTQALLNVISQERYEKIPDEIIKYALGRFGQPPGPMAEDVRDRILALPRARALALEELDAQPSLADVRGQVGLQCSDEELLLRLVLPAEQVNAMVGAGSSPRQATSLENPLPYLVRELSRRSTWTYVHVAKGDLRLSLRREPSAFSSRG